MSMSISELSLTEADLMALEAEGVEGLGGIGAPMEEVGRGDKFSDVPRYLLPPEDCRFDVSEMVWGKVRSQPWWPAQIFDPADASEEALKQNYKDGFLVAYFGNHTYAWNDITTLRPYRSHFSQMSQQSSMANFANAVDCSVDEVSRRVEFGLACYCTPSEVYGRFKSQRIDNAGIREGACVADGAYGPYNMVSFEPDKLVQYLDELARSPLVGYDKLDLTIAKAQLISFYRAKGYLELPSFSIHLAWPNIENERSCAEGTLVDVSVMEVGTPEVKKRKFRGMSSGKRSFSEDGLEKVKKQRSLADLMEYKNFDSVDGKDHQDNVGSHSRDSGRSKKRKISSKNVDKAITPAPNKSFKIGECISKVAIKLTRSPLTCKRSDRKVTKSDDVEENEQDDVASDVSPRTHERKAGSSEEHSSTKEMLSQLRLAAQDPLKLYSFLPMITSFFSDYWNRSYSTKGIKKMNGCQSTVKSGKSESDSDDSVNSEDGGDLDLVKDPDLISEEEAEKQLESDPSVKKDDDQLSDANVFEVTVGEVFDILDFVEGPDLISEEVAEKKFESGPSVKKDDDQLSDVNVVEVIIGEVFDDFDLVKDPYFISEQEAEKRLEPDLTGKKDDDQLSNVNVVEVSKDEVVGDLDLVKDPDLIVEEEAAKKLEPDPTAKDDDQLSNANVVEVSIDEVVGDLDLGKDSDLKSEEAAGEKLELDPTAEKDDDQLSNPNVVKLSIDEVVGDLDLGKDSDLKSEEEAEKLESDHSAKEHDDQLSNANVEGSMDEEVGDLDFVKDPDLINDEAEKKLDSDPDLTSDDEAENKLESDPSVKKDNDQSSNANVAEVSVNEVVDQESCRTALILNFSEVNILPSQADLIKIFGQYGPLVETETEITRKTNCAKVVFEKKADAEVAFSSTGKLRMFDPAPVRYHLRNLPSPSGTTDSCWEMDCRKEEVEEGGSREILLTEDPSSQMDGDALDEIASPPTENGVIKPECLTELIIEATNQISQPLGSEMHLDSGAKHPSVLPDATGRDLECTGGGQPLDTGDPNYPPPQILVPITNIPLEDNGKNHLAHRV